ncbi:MAG: AbrB/MazE/SpoVT family DNA-binding domain-containing protein [Leptospirales bacterium]
MIKKLIKHGNSLALIIDKPILELLKISDETLLEINTDGKNLIISPQSDDQAKGKVKNSLDKINRKFSKTLSKLAK